MASEEGKVSKCCGAVVNLVYGLRDREYVKPYSAYWHECTKCGKPCDIVSAQRVEGER